MTTTKTTRISKDGLLRWVYSQDNASVRFIGNVIHCHMSNQYRKLCGLHKLALADRVGTGNTIDQVSIDGRIVPIGELEQYA